MISIDVKFAFKKGTFLDDDGTPLILSVLDQDSYIKNFFSRLVCIYTANNINADGILIYPSKELTEDDTLIFHTLIFPNGKIIPDIRKKATLACTVKFRKVIEQKVLKVSNPKKIKMSVEVMYNPFILSCIENVNRMVQLHGIDNPSFIPLTGVPNDIEDIYDSYKLNPISCLLEDTVTDELKRLVNIFTSKFCDEFRGVPRCYIIPKTDKIDIAKLLCDRLYDDNLSMSLCILFRDAMRYDLLYNDKQVFVDDDFKLYEGNPIVVTIDDIVKQKALLESNEANLEYVDSNIFKQYKERYYNTTPLIFATDSYRTAQEIEELANQYGIYIKNLLPLVKISKARTYLKLKAQNDGFKRFYGKIQNIPNHKFTLKELDKIYADWKLSYMNKKIGGIHKKANKQISNIPKSSKEILNEMVGLKSIKTIIDDILSTIKMQEELKKRHLATSNPCRHMVFYGNPGTAKTTVARLLGNILKENGILESNKFIEVGKSDLVAGYVGQTPIKTMEKINKAKGGILFIDEAYALDDGYYGKEAIDVIVKEMENIREDTIIIFAGYKKDMEKFLKSNRGLSSRIAFHIEFNDYSKDELLDITKLILREKHYTITPDALNKIGNSIENHINDKEFGNGRFVRNILEQSMMKQAARITKTDTYKTINNEELTKLQSVDIVDLKKENKVAVIGF